MCVCEGVCTHVYTGKPEEGIWSFGAGVTSSCRLPNKGAQDQTVSLQEQHVPLAAEPSLPSLVVGLFCRCILCSSGSISGFSFCYFAPLSGTELILRWCTQHDWHWCMQFSCHYVNLVHVCLAALVTAVWGCVWLCRWAGLHSSSFLTIPDLSLCTGMFADLSAVLF